MRKMVDFPRLPGEVHHLRGGADDSPVRLDHQAAPNFLCAGLPIIGSGALRVFTEQRICSGTGEPERANTSHP